METMKFKVGDKVRVKSLEWYNENKNISGKIIAKEGENFGYFHPYMRSWCGDVLKIEKVKNGYYYTVTNGWKWYDWMLEDEPVNTKQEQLLKRNNMKTKMTKQEAFDFLLGKKVLCLNSSETIKVQKKLFEIGYMWSLEEQEPIIDYFAIFMKRKDLTMTSDINYWIEDESEKIEASEILSIEIEKPKFNPKDLKPFDKVLVRQGKNSEWLARFFDFCEDDNYYTTSGSAWVMCVPYNEETKHLHKTTEEAPEYYKIWK